MKKNFFLLLVLLPVFIAAQTSFSGIVKSAKNKEILPFATIITNTGLGKICDVDGKFSIQSNNTITQLTVSYVGFKTQKIPIAQSNKYLTILLEPYTESLSEVIVTTKENPALRIIRNAIANKDRNYIKKALNSYKYTSYNKFLLTANPDSITGNVDSIFVLKQGKRVFEKLDSTNYEFKKQIDRSHLYISEKVSEHTFKRGKNKKETIKATRMAGLKQPIYEFLALDFENFTFYDEVYNLVGNKYVNPLAKNAIKKYNYKILDTLINQKDSTFMIYYKPKKTKETVGLEGVLYINSEKYALEKGIAQLKGIITVKAVQTFSFKTKYNIWFPNLTEISIRKGINNESVKLFRGITFSATKKNDSISNSTYKDPSDVSYLISKTKIFDIKINEPVKVINSASTIEIDTDAPFRKEAYWNRFRTDSITKRGLETYKVIDSVSQAEGAERKLNIARKILKGYYPSKYFDFDLSQLINFNNYEGFRLGFGGITNTTFSKKIRFDAYTAYGFRDSKFKYHGGASVRVNKQNNTWIGAAYTNDLQEAAKLDFLFDDTSFSLINPRNLNIGQFYGYKTYEIHVDHDILPNLESKLKLSQGKYDTKFNYQYISPDNFLTDYQLSLAILALKWTPFSRYMNSPIGKIAVKNSTPKITVQLTKSFDNVLEGDFDFTQLNFKFEHTIKTLSNSSTSFLIQGGFIYGNAPLSHLYNATPNYSLKTPWRKRINFSGTNAFETMTFNEFISDKYVMIQGRQNFNRFKISSKLRPALSLISRFAIGDIENPNYHQGVSFKKMNKGYLESGFVLNHLVKGFGISSFYRYGAYSNPKFSDNLAVKLTYVLSLGF